MTDQLHSYLSALKTMTYFTLLLHLLADSKENTKRRIPIYKYNGNSQKQRIGRQIKRSKQCVNQQSWWRYILLLRRIMIVVVVKKSLSLKKNGRKRLRPPQNFIGLMMKSHIGVGEEVNLDACLLLCLILFISYYTLYTL